MVHIAGTKGKGSVASLVACALARQGERVGLYTSPHVQRIHERIRLDGAPIEDAPFARALIRALEVVENAEREGADAGGATWFDLMTATALLAFAEARVGWAVVEVGLGGRLDSTNAVQPAVTAITSIDLEHTEVLGGTLAAIAGEKAGILKEGVPCVCGVDRTGEAGRTIASRAAAVGCAVDWVPRRQSLIETNVALALGVLARLDRDAGVDVPAWRRSAALPGRMENASYRGVPVVLDGAHVASSLTAVLADLAARSDLTGSCVAVLSLGRDKDVEAMLKALSARVDRVHCTSVGERQWSADELAARSVAQGLEAIACDSPEDAMSTAAAAVTEGGWVLVTGSLHLVGAVRGGLDTDEPPGNTGCSPSARTSS